MELKLTRKCDSCNEFVSCPMTYFTDRLWFCSACSVPYQQPINPGAQVAINDLDDYDFDDVPTLPGISRDDYAVPVNKSSHPIKYIVKAPKDVLIAISRSIGMALSLNRNVEEVIDDSTGDLVKIEII